MRLWSPLASIRESEESGRKRKYRECEIHLESREEIHALFMHRS